MLQECLLWGSSTLSLKPRPSWAPPCIYPGKGVCTADEIQNPEWGGVGLPSNGLKPPLRNTKSPFICSQDSRGAGLPRVEVGDRGPCMDVGEPLC